MTLTPLIRALPLALSLSLSLPLPACLDWDREDAQGNWFLCQPCETPDDCGGPEDYCYENDDHERFCVKDCSAGQRCPEGWACYTLIRNAYKGKQCLPRDKRCP